METKLQIPNGTTVLVLGLCSIVFSCVFVGLVLGIIGVVLGNKAKSIYRESPDKYDGFQSLNAGWIMSIIGLCIGAIYSIYYFLVGAAIFSIFSAANEIGAFDNL